MADEKAAVPSQSSRPEEVLRAFWAAMNAWEVSAYRTMPSPSDFDAYLLYRDRINAERKPLIEKYCTPKKRVYGENKAVGSPPRYDPAEELVEEMVEESAGRVVLKTLRTQFPVGEHFYVLLRRGGLWRVDNCYWYAYDGKLVRDIL